MLQHPMPNLPLNPSHGANGAVEATPHDPVLAAKSSVTRALVSSFGEVTGILMQSAQFRTLQLSDLEWLVMPAVINNQFAVGYTRSAGAGLAIPAGVVLWAMVQKSTDERLSADGRHPLRLAPKEWASGPIPWLVCAAGQPQAVLAIMQDLTRRRFSATGLKTTVRLSDGKIMTQVIGGPSAKTG